MEKVTGKVKSCPRKASTGRFSEAVGVGAKAGLARAGRRAPRGEASDSNVVSSVGNRCRRARRAAE